jgi:hypothetical protein
MNPYNACASCSRYIKRGDRGCPFCGSANRPVRQEEPRLSARMSRARWLAFGSTLAIAGCSGDATMTAMDQLAPTICRIGERNAIPG